MIFQGTFFQKVPWIAKGYRNGCFLIAFYNLYKKKW